MVVPIISLARRRLAAAARVHNGAVRACSWCCGLVLLMASGACGAGTAGSSAAPPLVVCGTTLSDSAAGPALFDATSQRLRVPVADAGNQVYLKVASTCARGAAIELEPADAASIVAHADARDGQPAAVVISISKTETVVVSGRRDGAIVASATLIPLPMCPRDNTGVVRQRSSTCRDH